MLCTTHISTDTQTESGEKKNNITRLTKTQRQTEIGRREKQEDKK